KELPPNLVPRSESLARAPMDPALAIDAEFLSSVVERWRGAMLSNGVRGEDSSQEFDTLASEGRCAKPARAPPTGRGPCRTAAGSRGRTRQKTLKAMRRKGVTAQSKKSHRRCGRAIT